MHRWSGLTSTVADTLGITDTGQTIVNKTRLQGNGVERDGQGRRVVSMLEIDIRADIFLSELSFAIDN